MTSLQESTSEANTKTAEPALPSFADVAAAAERLRGKAVRTPLLESPALNQRLGARVLLKPETQQRTGSFKFRGAYNKISQLSPSALKAGVVAYSSGNHAQGVAAAAQMLGSPATIVMPSDAPTIKIENTRSYGAEVVLYERDSKARETLALEIAHKTGATLVRPYDDPDVIAGQGTCGLEIIEQAAAVGVRLDRVLTCCSGGGLTAGCALSFQEKSPETEVYTVEPADFDDTARSLAAGERLANTPGGKSFCDALLSPEPGSITFAINRRKVKAGLAVSDDEVAQAMAYAFRTLKLVVEPGGAVALAALLSGKLAVEGGAVAVLLSGGNVDPEIFTRVISG